MNFCEKSVAFNAHLAKQQPDPEPKFHPPCLVPKFSHEFGVLRQDFGCGATVFERIVAQVFDQ